MFESGVAHRRSVTVLCMQYKIRCKPMHTCYGALSGPCVSVRVTRCALVAHRYAYASPRCRTLQYCRTFIRLSVFLWIDLGDPVFDGVRLAGFKSRAKCLFVGLAARSLFVSYCFDFHFFHSMGRYCGAGVFGLTGC